MSRPGASRRRARVHPISTAYDGLGKGQLWVTGGKTRSEHMFSELLQVADIFDDPAAPDAAQSYSD